MKEPKAELPIIFSTRMVRAIASGNKTVTRRLSGLDEANKDPSAWKPHDFRYVHGRLIEGFVSTEEGNDDRIEVACPYDAPLLWVREAFLRRASGIATVYRAEMSDIDGAGFGAMYGGWKPSIHMPRADARILLDLREIAIVRLQTINDADLVAEGVVGRLAFERLEGFRMLWDLINGKKAPWAANPWVWRIKFSRNEGTKVPNAG